MTVLGDSLLAALAALLLVTLAGYGPSRAFLPPVLRSWFWLATPLVGLTVSAVLLGWLNLFLPVRLAVVGLLALGVVGIFVTRWSPAPGPQAGREQLAVGLGAFAALVVALVPLWGRPDLLSIGPNWDIEIYLPMAQYLAEHATGFGLSHPAGFPFPGNPNPLLWRINFFDPRWSGLTFAQLQAAAGSLTGQESYQNLPGLLALCHMLSIPAVFLLARVAFRLPFGLALLSGGLFAVNPAALYVIYWSFGQQATSLPLLPWALTLLAIAAVTPGPAGRRWFGWLPGPVPSPLPLASLALAAVMASFIPAVTLYIAAAALLAVLLRTALIPLVACAALSFLLAPWAYLRGATRLYHFAADRGVEGLTAGPNVSYFPPLGWAFGLTPSPDHGLLGILAPEDPASGLLLMLVRIAIVGLTTLGLAAAFRTRSYPLFAFGGACVVLLLLLRFVMPYPYGYLKVLAGSAGILLPLVLTGGWALTHLRPHVRPPVFAAGVLLAAINLYVLTVLIPTTGERSAMEFRGLEAMTAAIPPDATVLVSGHPDYHGPKSGALAYFLRDRRLFGYISTGFSSFYRVRQDGIYDYAVYHEHEPVNRELHGEGDLVWSGSGLRLYRFRPEIVYFRDIGDSGAPPIIEETGGRGAASGLRITEWTEDGYPVFDGWSPPGMGELAVTTRAENRYPELQYRDHAAFALPLAGARRTAQASARPFGDPVYQLVVGIAALREQEVTIKVDDEATVFTKVRAGVGSYAAGYASTPSQVEITNMVESPVYLKSISLYRPEASLPAEIDESALLVRWEARRAGQAAIVAIDYLGPRFKPVIDIYSEDGLTHYGYWELPAPRPLALRPYRLRFDASARLMSLIQRRSGDARTLEGWRGEAEDGHYQAMLALWEGEQLIRTVPLFKFTVEEGRLIELQGAPRVYIG